MSKIKRIEIKNRWSGVTIFSHEIENNNFRLTLLEAIKKGADLSSADLSSANLSSADLSSIKNDYWVLLLNAIPEVKNLKKAIKYGKINGSTYEGECACLCGTLEKSTDNKLARRIYDLRDSGRPIERFFLGINKGDTPENSQFSKLALDWLLEFESLINHKK
ncbi:MAG: hypothetical protein HKN40_00370 [Winogradskyella sp.]|uniref:pentapeptide repeat-containing protein n=1 Tax=Winogradskyella sp. TaxID=1883156 RepID=UPI00184D4999|nr:hypothetical protein [Winogradskyella sp.]